MKTHSGEKPYKCEVCGKKFAYISSVNQHKNTHTGLERKHKCDPCGKRFLNQGHLKRHTMIHTGEKPHKCDVCGKQFSQNAALKHTSEHTQGRNMNVTFVVECIVAYMNT